MCGQAKILEMPLDTLTSILRGEARMLNFPPDAQVVGFVGDQACPRLLMRVHSGSYPSVEQLEIVPSVIARGARRPILKLAKRTAVQP